MLILCFRLDCWSNGETIRILYIYSSYLKYFFSFSFAVNNNRNTWMLFKMENKECNQTNIFTFSLHFNFNVYACTNASSRLFLKSLHSNINTKHIYTMKVNIDKGHKWNETKQQGKKTYRMNKTREIIVGKDLTKQFVIIFVFYLQFRIQHQQLFILFNDEQEKPKRHSQTNSRNLIYQLKFSFCCYNCIIFFSPRISHQNIFAFDSNELHFIWKLKYGFVDENSS